MKHKPWHKHAPCSLLSTFHVKAYLNSWHQGENPGKFQKLFLIQGFSQAGNYTGLYVMCTNSARRVKIYTTFNNISPIIPMQVLHDNELDDVYTLSNSFVTTTFLSVQLWFMTSDTKIPACKFFTASRLELCVESAALDQKCSKSSLGRFKCTQSLSHENIALMCLCDF